jgi:uncharacterized phage protein (TIGR02218 family)
MRNISVALDDYLQSPPSPVAVLIKVSRVDGVTMGFTDWDLPITYSGLEYQPNSVTPAAPKTNADLTTDQTDMTFAIDSTYILEEDLDGGRYDYADITIMRVNPNDLTMLHITDIKGTTGQADYGDGQAQLAINSLGQKLNQQIGDVITPLCRVNQLGDSQCKVNMTGFRHSATVATVVDVRTLIFSDSNITGYYDYGMVRFGTIGGGGGLNHDISMEVKTSTSDGHGNMTIVLQEPTKFTVIVGDAVVLEAGCDRNPLTCRSKFNNLVNIHSEPYVPGNDYLATTGRPPS